MIRFALRSCFFVLALLPPMAPVLCADDIDKKSQVDSLLAAAAVANLRAQDSRPFHLRLEIHAANLGSKPLDITYDEIWRSPSDWKRKITYPGFEQEEVRDSEGRWLTRNQDFRPHAIFLVSRAVDMAMKVSLLPDEQILKVSDRKKDGLELQCADSQHQKWERTLCFSSGGPLVSSDEYNEFDGRKQGGEYFDFQKFGEKQYPRQMRVSQNGRQVLEVKVVELGEPPSTTPAHFDHAAIARSMAVCDRLEESAPAKRVQPEYPADARWGHQQGTVTLYAALAADGSVDHVKVLETAGASLDTAAMQAVKQWQYAPLTCGGQPLPTEIEVHVNFSLRWK